jgi:acyl carrier protein
MFLEAIKKAISEEFFIDEDQITEESNLKDDLGIDSLASMQLILDMEKQFNIHVEDEEVMDIETVADVVALLEKKTKGEA